MATLGDLLEIRSQPALRLKAHLEWVARGDAWPTAPWLRGHVTLDDVYILPDVTRHDGTGVRPDRAAEERAALDPAHDEERGRRPWEQEWASVRRAVVKGRAGEGKSTLLQWTSRQVARASLALWHARTAPLDAIPVPIVLRADQIMRAGSVEGAIAVACAPRPLVVDPSTPMSRPVTTTGGLTLDELLDALKQETAWLFVDALDERPREEDVPSGAAKHALATLKHVRARLLLSVRTYAWHPEQVPFRVASAGTPDEGEAPRYHVRRSSLLSSGSATPASPADADLVVCELAKLTRDQREAVVARWHPGLGHATRREQLTRLLDVAPMVELTNNALLLTLLCAAALVPGRRISAATRRAELYEWLVADFAARQDNAAISLDPAGDVVLRRVAILAQAAWGLWQITAGDDFTHGQWREQVRAAADHPGDDVVALLAQVEAAGLLMTVGARRNFFPKTVFEYLAGAGLVQAAAVARRINAAEVRTIATAFTTYGHEDWWREVFTLAIGHLAVVQDRRDVAAALVLETVASCSTVSNAQRGAVMATLGEGLIEAGERDERLPANLTGGPTAGAPLLEQAARDARDVLCRALLATMTNAEPPGAAGHVPAIIRARAGAALGWVGDPRFDPGGYWLPRATAADPLGGFVWISKGRFTMGAEDDDVDGNDAERPPHLVKIGRPFLIGRWPVTVAQWAAYAWETGADVDSRCLQDPPTSPVRFVSAREADAYCAWLTGQLAPAGGLAARGAALVARFRTLSRSVRRVEARLPTEEEWEFVASGGAADRKFTYGPRFDADAANSIETRIFAPSAVGSFARGATPDDCRVEELSGNVSEHTSSVWRPSYARGARVSSSLRVVRGGSFYFDWSFVRAASRNSFESDFRYVGLGFRVAVSPLRFCSSDL